MKVFISWSGDKSKKCGEALKEWIPTVIQNVVPYFTPSDIEKGTRWTTDIAKELEESHVGIICVTRDNIHNDWILFEAGALSKSLTKSHVCPILFGVNNSDLIGPLQQFQTTIFNKDDLLRLLKLINSKLSENKLAQNLLEKAFERWWPDIESTIESIMSEVEHKDPIRSERELIEEILALSRNIEEKVLLPKLTVSSLKELIIAITSLYETFVAEETDYNDVIHAFEELVRPINVAFSFFRGIDRSLDEAFVKYRKIKYEPKSSEDEIPF